MKQRIKNFSGILEKLNCDSFLVSDPDNIAYLTGFRLTQGYLLVEASGKMLCFTNFLYSQIVKSIACWQVIVSSAKNNIFDLIAGEVSKLKHKRVGFEAKKMPFLEYKTLKILLLKKNINFIGESDVIEKIRMIKTKKEISFIKKSILVSKEAFKFAKEIADSDMTEKDLSIEVEKFLRLKGDNEIAFETIVASGKNTVFPHHLSSDCKLDRNFFLIDLGSKYYGYCADLTRMLIWGKMPTLFTKIYATVRKAQELSIKKIKDGVKASEVDRAAREFIGKKGWAKYFGHDTGHGVGLSVHELPMLGPLSGEILKEGMVVTIEPAIYFKDKFGVRIEDMILVKHGKGEILSGDINR